MTTRRSEISDIRPIIRRADQIVLAWVFRLTLLEDDKAIYEDLQAPVPAGDQRVFAGWRQSEILALCNTWTLGNPAVANLHRNLSMRLEVVERRDLNVQDLPQ